VVIGLLWLVDTMVGEPVLGAKRLLLALITMPLLSLLLLVTQQQLAVASRSFGGGARGGAFLFQQFHYRQQQQHMGSIIGTKNWRSRPCALVRRLYFQTAGQLYCQTAAAAAATAAGTTTKHSNDTASSLRSAEEALDRLARRGKSWQRLRHLVDLSVQQPLPHSHSSTRTSVADVGTDHGLLAMGLAATGQFAPVVGVDVSERALQRGAWELQRQVVESLSQQQHPANKTSVDHQEDLVLPVFFQSDGLSGLAKGQADTVCIAGMGVHTMLEILTQRTNATQMDELLLDVLDCRRLVLQPTNSRPRHLLRLYDTLRGMGWGAQDERIEYVSSRCYLSTCFERDGDDGDGDGSLLPGTILVANNEKKADSEMSSILADWVAHHCTWILQDLGKKSSSPFLVDDREARWMEAFATIPDRIKSSSRNKSTSGGSG